MRIGFDGRSLQEEYSSGIGEYTRNLYEALFPLLSGHEVVVFFNKFHPSAPRGHAWMSLPHVRVQGFRIPNKLFHAAQTAFKWPTLDRLLGGLDVFFAPNWQFMSFSPRVRLVTVVHDVSFLHDPHFFSLKGRAWHALVQPEWMMRRSDAIVTVSEHTRDDVVERLSIEAGKCHVVYPGVDERFVPTRNVNVERKYGLGVPYFISLATVEPRKNIAAVMRAFAAVESQLPEAYELLIVGKLGFLAKELRRQRSSSRMRFLGYVDRNDLPTLLSRAQALVYPSFYEGFGFPPLEALRCGTRVITSHVTSLPEVLGEHAVYVNPYDTRTLEQVLLKVATIDDEPVQKEKRIQHAMQYQWPATAHRINKILVGDF